MVVDNISTAYTEVLRTIPWFHLTIASSAFFYILELILDIRQSNKLKKIKEVPPILSNVITQEEFEQSREWNLMRCRFMLSEATIGFVLECVALYCGLLVWLWDQTLTIMEAIPYVSLSAENKITRGVMYIFLVSIFSTVVRFPFEIYRTLFIDTKFDVSAVHPTLRQWAWQQLKIFVLSIVLGTPCLATILTLLNWQFPYHWFYTCVFLSIVIVFFTDIYPKIIAPLFDTFTPLENSELRDQIHRLAERLNFPLEDIFLVVDPNNMRAVHSNAYLMGFSGSKRVVLYETLIKQLTISEILAILAHEIGHYKYNHTWKQLVLQLFSAGNFIFLLSRILFVPEYFTCFGFAEPDTAVGLVLFSYLYGSFLANCMHVFANRINRGFEYSADDYAVELGLGLDLENALKKIHSNTLANFVPDTHYSNYHYSHPCLSERLERIQAKRKKLK